MDRLLCGNIHFIQQTDDNGEWILLGIYIFMVLDSWSQKCEMHHNNNVSTSYFKPTEKKIVMVLLKVKAAVAIYIAAKKLVKSVK